MSADPIAPFRAAASPEQRALLTPVAGGHVFLGTWEALADLDTATCAACGEHIKQDGELAEVVEHDGAGVGHRIMCNGWPASAPPGAALSIVRGMARQRQAPEDVGDLLPSLPSHEARTELYSAHWDASQPHADVRPSLFRIGKAFEALTAALSDEEHALRMALKHDERSRALRPMSPEYALAALTPDRLDEFDRLAREAAERASGATPGRWKLWGMDVYADQDGTSNIDTAVRVADTFFTNERSQFRTNDAAFIAAAREDVPALAAAVLALSAEVRRLREENDRMRPVVDAAKVWNEDGALAGEVALSNALASGEPPRAGEEQS